MDRGLFFLDNDEINKAAEQLLVCLASAKDAGGLRVGTTQYLTPEQARVGVAVALTALTGMNFMPDNALLVDLRSGKSWPPSRADTDMAKLVADPPRTGPFAASYKCPNCGSYALEHRAVDDSSYCCSCKHKWRWRDMSKEETSHITPEVARLGTGEIK